MKFSTAVTGAYVMAFAGSSSSSTNAMKIKATDNHDGIAMDSRMGQVLMSKAERVLEEAAELDMSFVSGYSIKFQGCHHVSQWNSDAEDEDDVRIKTKRLVRFRLCPSESCSSSKSTGCTSKYGDYVVDMNTFVEAYLQDIEDDIENICAETKTECQEKCGENDNEDCMYACYEGYNLERCVNGDDEQENGQLDPQEYMECAQFDLDGGNGDRRRRKLEDEMEYYVGPYCADQGGEIHLGLFADDTCTTFVNNGESTFYSVMGYELPFSDSSLVSNRCMSCSGNDDGEVSELCEDVYAVSGKCETKMSAVDYPNESACTYIEGIKIIRADGVIRTSKTKKSKAAAVCIGLFLTLAVLLAAYVMYLRTKLGRAKINLSAAAGATLA